MKTITIFLFIFLGWLTLVGQESQLPEHVVLYEYPDSTTFGLELFRKQDSMVGIALSHFEQDHINPNIQFTIYRDTVENYVWKEKVHFFQDGELCGEF